MADKNPTFADRLNDIGLEGTTTSQPLASGLGATPQQTAMMGTQAQKQATIAQRLQSAQPQQQELFRAKRLEAPREELTVEEQLQAERQEKLAKLGNIGLQIQNTIQQNIQSAAQAQTGGIEVQQPLLAQALNLQDAQVEIAKQDPASTYNKVRNILDTFVASNDPNDLEKAFAAIDNLKVFGLSSADAKRLVGLTQDAMAKRTGQVVAENVLDQVTIKDVNLQELGLAQGQQEVADLLGVSLEEAQNLTIDEFADAVESKRRDEFARIDNLKAQLATTPAGSRQREILLRELRDLGQVGVTGVEAEAVENVEDIDLATFIKVGDQQIKVEEFLDDEALSQMVTDFINEDDPLAKDNLIPEEQFPELRAWIDQNQMALAKLSNTADDTKAKFDQANEEYKNLNKLDDLEVSLNRDLLNLAIPGYDPTKALTSSQVAAAKAKFNSSTIGQLAATKGADQTEKKQILNKLNALPQVDMQKIAKLPVNALLIANEAANEIEQNPDLARFLGMSRPANGLVLDAAQQNRINDYADVIQSISQTNPSWLVSEGPVLNNLKTLSAKDLQTLQNNPDRFKDLQKYTAERQRAERAQTPDEKLSYLLGRDLTLHDLNAEFQDAQFWASLGDKDAAERASRLGQMFFKWDQFIPGDKVTGVGITVNDISNRFNMSIRELAASPAQITNQGLQTAELNNVRDQLGNRSMVRGPSAEHKMNQQYIDDGQLRVSDIQNLPESEQARIAKWAETIPGINIDLNGFSSYEEFDNDRKEAAAFQSTEQTLQSDGIEGLDDLGDYLITKLAEDPDQFPFEQTGKYNPLTPPTLEEIARLKRMIPKMQNLANIAVSDNQKALYQEVINMLNESIPKLQKTREDMLYGSVGGGALGQLFTQTEEERRIVAERESQQQPATTAEEPLDISGLFT